MTWLLLIAAALALAYWLFASPTSQIFGKFSYRGPGKQKLVALTFDDGPNQPYTGKLLDTLARENVTATFFVVGENLKKHPEAVKRAAKDGHTIANHSLSHLFRNYVLQPNFDNEIMANQSLIGKTIGQTPALFRPPWLFRHPLLFSSLRKHGLTPISGTFVNNWEIFQPSGAKIANSAYRRTKPGTILIFHDGYNAKGASRTETVAGVELLINKLKKDGYQFASVNELLGIPAYQR